VAIILSAFGNVNTGFYEVEAAGSMKNMKTSDYSKMIQGGLNKTQLTDLLSYIAPESGILKGKALNNKGKDSFMLIVVGNNLKHYDNSAQMKYHSNWYSFDIKYINKYLSSFSNYKYKPNKVYEKGDIYSDTSGVYTDKKKLHVYCPGIGWELHAKINSAKYDNKKMVITFTNYFLTEKKGTYKAVLKKQKNGKYKIESVALSTQYYDMTTNSYSHYATLRGKVVAFSGTDDHGEKATLYKLVLSTPLKVKTRLKGEITVKSVYLGVYVKDFVKNSVGKTISVYGPMYEGSNGYPLAITAEKKVK
jgi:hypothetical protein